MEKKGKKRHLSYFNMPRNSFCTVFLWTKVTKSLFGIGTKKSKTVSNKKFYKPLKLGTDRGFEIVVTIYCLFTGQRKKGG